MPFWESPLCLRWVWNFWTSSTEMLWKTAGMRLIRDWSPRFVRLPQTPHFWIGSAFDVNTFGVFIIACRFQCAPSWKSKPNNWESEFVSAFKLTKTNFKLQGNLKTFDLPGASAVCLKLFAVYALHPLLESFNALNASSWKAHRLLIIWTTFSLVVFRSVP